MSIQGHGAAKARRAVLATCLLGKSVEKIHNRETYLPNTRLTGPTGAGSFAGLATALASRPVSHFGLQVLAQHAGRRFLFGLLGGPRLLGLGLGVNLNCRLNDRGRGGRERALDRGSLGTVTAGAVFVTIHLCSRLLRVSGALPSHSGPLQLNNLARIHAALRPPRRRAPATRVPSLHLLDHRRPRRPVRPPRRASSTALPLVA